MSMIVPIPGYEKYYGATEDGRIYSLNYRRTGSVVELAQSSLFDKRRKNTSMYRRVKAYFVCKSTPTPVHRLIALTFVPNPNGYPCVNHIDGVKSNNHYLNLEWCTNHQNIVHAENAGLASHLAGEEHPLHVLTESEVIAIRKELLEVPAYRGQLKEIGDRYGVSRYCIFDIKYRRSWVHL